jgi:multidrug efflux system membrane fusion protein
VPVTVAPATTKDVPVNLQTIGTVESIQTVEVKSRVAGQLVAIAFEPGSVVEEGQLLFQIDPRPFEHAVDAAEAALAEARSQARIAASDAARFTELERRGAIAAQQGQQARATATTTRAAVEAAKAQLESARLDLAYTSIEAPVRARSGELLVHVGDQIPANAATPMLTLEVIQPIYVRFSVPGDQLHSIRESMQGGELPVAATPKGGAEPRQGTLTFIDNQVDLRTGTILLKATFPNEDQTLWPGEPVDVALTVRTLAGAVVVPSAAIQVGAQGSYAFVVDPQQRVEIRPLHVGPAVDGQTAILDGIRPGERVVTSGQLRLRPGVQVQVQEPAP